MCLIKVGVNGSMDRTLLVKMSGDEGKKEKKWKERGKKKERGERCLLMRCLLLELSFSDRSLRWMFAFTYSGMFFLWITSLVCNKNNLNIMGMCRILAVDRSIQI